MTAGSGAPGEACITCGDVAVELQVVEVDRAAGLATCRDAAGRSETVEVSLVEEPRPGQTLLVHAGTAIARIDGGAAA
jgi:hydrogenase maturation factor